jgi:hypothetical protein
MDAIEFTFPDSGQVSVSRETKAQSQWIRPSEVNYKKTDASG